MAARVPDQVPGVVIQMRAMDVFVAGSQQAGAAELQNLRAEIVDVQHRRHPDLAGEGVELGIDAGAERERQQLVLGAEVAALDTGDVLRILRGRPGAAVIGIDGADAGIPQGRDAGVAVLGRVADLRDVDDGGGAHIHEAERAQQHAHIGVRGQIGRREIALDVAVVVRIEHPVGQDVAQQALIGVAVGIDEARDHDPVAGVDHRGGIVGERDIRPHLADLAVLDHHIGAREVADLPVDRQHQAALDENAPRALQAGKLGIRGRHGGALAQRRARQGCGTGRQRPGARLQKSAP
jgi:hypothetical protein